MLCFLYRLCQVGWHHICTYIIVFGLIHLTFLCSGHLVVSGTYHFLDFWNSMNIEFRLNLIVQEILLTIDLILRFYENLQCKYLHLKFYEVILSTHLFCEKCFRLFKGNKRKVHWLSKVNGKILVKSNDLTQP